MNKKMKTLLSKIILAVVLAVCALPAFSAAPPPQNRGRVSLAPTSAPAAQTVQPRVQPRGQVARTAPSAPLNAPTMAVAAAPAVDEISEEVRTVSDETRDFTNELDELRREMAGEFSTSTSREAVFAGQEQAEREINAYNQGIRDATKSSCMSELAACIKKECGDGYQKCGDNGDAWWTPRLVSCRQQTSCSGSEFNLYGDIIKKDARVSARIEIVESIIKGDGEYSACLQQQCGVRQTESLLSGGRYFGFNGCASQSKINAAIAACRPIYDQYREFDSGLSTRFTNALGMLRVEKEKRIAEIQSDLDRIVADMRRTCNLIGATLDERSGECVYTAFFTVERDNRRFTAASKKLLPGAEYQCTDTWFGIDLTTFMQNAIAEDVEARGASSALMGAGLGMAAGVGLDALSGAMGGAGNASNAPAAAGGNPTASTATTK